MISFTGLGDESLRPRRGTPHSAGIDLFFPATDILLGQEKKLVDLGLRVSMPPGHFGKMELRSSAAFRHNLQLHAGVIGGLFSPPSATSYNRLLPRFRLHRASSGLAPQHGAGLDRPTAGRGLRAAHCHPLQRGDSNRGGAGNCNPHRERNLGLRLHECSLL